ncbi:MAG: 2-amino-3,7-dideoxy-D-threo-hept-6-ulosonate synthase [Promethearchaeota archaeon]
MPSRHRKRTYGSDTMSSFIGKKYRLQRIFHPKSGRTVMIPMDHGITQGPLSGLVNYEQIIDIVSQNGANAIIGHAGLRLHSNLQQLWQIPFLLHISASSDLSSDPNNKVFVNTVDEALKMAADAISIHINIGGLYDAPMLANLGTIARECRTAGLPLLAMMYPRGTEITNEYDVENVKKVARIGAELGADIVKTNYTGSIDSFREVVKGCPVPVIIAGGSSISTKDLLQLASDAVEAGGKGVSFGRNIFQSPHPGELTKAVSLVVHENYTVDEARQSSGMNKWKV